MEDRNEDATMRTIDIDIVLRWLAPFKTHRAAVSWKNRDCTPFACASEVASRKTPARNFKPRT
jgi:hypothetical protein